MRAFTSLGSRGLRSARRMKSTIAPMRPPSRFQAPPEPMAVANVQELMEKLRPKPTLPSMQPADKPVYSEMSDQDIAQLVQEGEIKFHNIERTLNDLERAVRIRRLVVESKTGRDIQHLPYQHYNYSPVFGQCCENVIGIVPVPVGVAGPLLVDGQEYFVPMATTEGALIASTTRGCKAISMSGGTATEVTRDAMSRAPVLQAANVKEAARVKRFLDENFDLLAAEFGTTTRFGKLLSIQTHVAGRNLYPRFSASSGDAMGMNMVGKGVDKALAILTSQFDVKVLALSGNVCTDKKPAAVNWVNGRGKSVIVDCTIKGEVIQKVLHTSVEALCQTNIAKNLVGSALAGSIGGYNAHSANIVAAMFLATGQDPAQVVASSNCMTIMEPANDGQDLYMSITMPSLEVGTVGGGTALAGQSSMLELLGCSGSHASEPGANARKLASIIASTVMAGELSLMSALTSGHLISSHMRLNRKPSATH